MTIRNLTEAIYVYVTAFAEGDADAMLFALLFVSQHLGCSMSRASKALASL